MKKFSIAFVSLLLGSMTYAFAAESADSAILPSEGSDDSSQEISGNTSESLFESGCFIQQLTCRNFPQSVGYFQDNFEGSGSNQARCLQRSVDYFNWCGNKAGQFTEARYFGAGPTLQARRIYEADGCRAVTSCARTGGNIDSWDSNFNGSDGSDGVCKNRSADYANWCQNRAGVESQTIFYAKGGTQGGTQYGGSVTYAHAAREGCRIIGYCSNQKLRINTDEFPQDANKAATCLNRATQLYNSCGNSSAGNICGNQRNQRCGFEVTFFTGGAFPLSQAIPKNSTLFPAGSSTVFVQPRPTPRPR